MAHDAGRCGWLSILSGDETVSELLSLPRAARRLGVSARWLKLEAAAGRVPCLRADSRYLFDIDTVIQALRPRAVRGEGTEDCEGDDAE